MALDARRFASSLAWILAGALGCGPGGGGAAEAESPPVRWQPSWPGTQIAVLRGSPSAEGPFAFLFRMPDGYWTHPHRHPVEARIRVVSGAYLVGYGETLDAGAAKVYAKDAEIRIEPGRAHFDGARGETVIEVSGEGPWGVSFLDPGKDPSAPQGPR